MADDDTGSIWTHFEGTAIQGPLADTGAELEQRPIVHERWADWVAEHPDTVVLDWYEEFADNYRDVEVGRAGLGPQFQDTILNWDDRLPENELVVGVNVGDEYRAYVLDDFPAAPTAVNDELDGEPIVAFVDASTDFGLAYSAVVDGQQLEFAVEDDRWVDESGSTWNSSGLATAGPMAGAQLTYASSFVSEWYGWAAYHPSTSIYGE